MYLRKKFVIFLSILVVLSFSICFSAYSEPLQLTSSDGAVLDETNVNSIAKIIVVFTAEVDSNNLPVIKQKEELALDITPKVISANTLEYAGVSHGTWSLDLPSSSSVKVKTAKIEVPKADSMVNDPNTVWVQPKLSKPRPKFVPYSQK